MERIIKYIYSCFNMYLIGYKLAMDVCDGNCFLVQTFAGSIRKQGQVFQQRIGSTITTN